MNALQKIKLTIMILLCLAASLPAVAATNRNRSAQNADEIVQFLEARNNSIKSFEIKLKQVSFDIDLEDYETFKEDMLNIEQNKDSNLSSSEKAEKLIYKWGNPQMRLERHGIQNGERFRESYIKDGNDTEIRCYDGLLYYDYSIQHPQFVINCKVPNVKHTNLSDIGFGFNAEALRNGGKILSFEQNEKQIQIEFKYSETSSMVVKQIFNNDFRLLYSQTQINENYQVENYYLLHKNIEGYLVPSIIINVDINKNNNKCGIMLYLIEDVKFNPFLTNEDFSVGKIPDKTLVVDYRFNPERLEKYGVFRYAAYNPNIVQAGLREAEDLIESLNNSRSERQNLSMRDSRTGKKALSIDVQKWLHKPINLNTWPPDQLTIVNFWEIGCGFCVREIPENNELYEWFKEKGIPFFSIHQARNDTDSIMNFIQNSKDTDNDIDINKIQYPVAVDKPVTNRIGWNSATFNKYGIDEIPNYVIIGKDGNVISYEGKIEKENIEKILSGNKDIIAKMQGKQKPVRKLNAIPTGWLEDNLEPNSQIKGRFFIYREDTPDFVIRNINTDKEIESQLIPHTSMGQAVGELLLSAKVPDRGKSLKGNISITAQHSQVSELITIPYELKSKSIVDYVSPVIWFGSVQNGNKATKTIQLHVDPNYEISVNKDTVPSNMQFKIKDFEDKPNDISIDCIFQSNKTCFQQGNIELLVMDKQNNKESVKLEYCAFVY